MRLWAYNSINQKKNKQTKNKIRTTQRVNKHKTHLNLWRQTIFDWTHFLQFLFSKQNCIHSCFRNKYAQMRTNKQHKYTKNISNWSRKPQKTVQNKSNQIGSLYLFFCFSRWIKQKNDLRSGMCMCTVYVLECMCLCPMRMVQMCFLMIKSASMYQCINWSVN